MHKHTIIPLIGVVVTGAFILILNLALRAWQTPEMTGSRPQESERGSGILISDVDETLPMADDQATVTPTGTPTSLPDITITRTISRTPAATEIASDTATPNPSVTALPTSPETAIPTASEQCTGTPLIEHLAVWSEPRLDSVQLGVIEPGEMYPVYDYVNTGSDTQFNTRFYQIGYQGMLAWTAVIYFQLSGDCSSLPIPVVPTTAPPTVPSPLRGETWTMVSTHVWSDPCSGGATGEVTVPVTLGFDENNTLISLSWYSTVWELTALQKVGGVTYNGVAVIERTGAQSIIDVVNLVFTSPRTFEGDRTRTVTTGERVCQAYYTVRGSRNE